MSIKEILQTDVKTINESATVGEAAKFFIDVGMNNAMVCNEKHEFIGILSQRDLLLSAMPDVEEVYHSHVGYQGLNLHFLKSAREKINSSIKYCIVREPYTLLPDDTIVKAVTIMINNNITSVPVVENKKLLGIITQIKIMELFTIPDLLNLE